MWISTSAIAAEKYKTVNLAGAAVIASVTNALHGIEFPFVFGGDGASFAVSPALLAAARTALSATADWVRRELDLSLRVGLVPVAVIRAQGLDVRVARHAPSSDVSYAMFTGGGLAWAEAALKRGEFSVAPTENGNPDLSGLSCRFNEIPATRGLILSLIVQPAPGVDPNRFRREIDEVLGLVERSPGAGHPLSAGLTMAWLPQGLGLEARARHGGPRAFRQASLMGRTLLDRVLTTVGLGKKPADIELRRKAIVDNSDFRKFDDGLRMVLDCDEHLERRLRKRLERAAAQGLLKFGLHRQDAAMMTCFTPSASRAEHVHFIDGARGGYASAATALKQSAI